MNQESHTLGDGSSKYNIYRKEGKIISSVSPEERRDIERTDKTLKDFGKASEGMRQSGAVFRDLKKMLQGFLRAFMHGARAPSALSHAFSTLIGTRSGVSSGVKKLRKEDREKILKLKKEIIDPAQDEEYKKLLKKKEKADADLAAERARYESSVHPVKNLWKGRTSKAETAQRNAVANMEARGAEIEKLNEEKKEEIKKLGGDRDGGDPDGGDPKGGGAGAAGGLGGLAGIAGHPAVMIAMVIIVALKKLFNEFMGPGIELSKSLKSAGMPKLVNAFNIAAEPLTEVMDIISQLFTPVFIPMIQNITKAVVEKIPEIQKTVQGLSDSGLFERIAESAVELTDQLPYFMEKFVVWAALNWGMTIDTIITYMPLISTSLDVIVGITGWIYDIIKALKDVSRDIADGWNNYWNSPRLPWMGENPYGGGLSPIRPFGTQNNTVNFGRKGGIY